MPSSSRRCASVGRFRESTEGELSPTAELVDEELSPAVHDSTLPKRLHHGEKLLVTHPALQDQGIDPFRRFIIDVESTFTEDGGAGTKRELIIDKK